MRTIITLGLLLMLSGSYAQNADLSVGFKPFSFQHPETGEEVVIRDWDAVREHQDLVQFRMNSTRSQCGACEDLNGNPGTLQIGGCGHVDPSELPCANVYCETSFCR